MIFKNFLLWIFKPIVKYHPVTKKVKLSLNIKYKYENNKELWCSSTKKTVEIKRFKNLNGHKEEVTCIKKLTQSKIVTGSIDNTVKIWDSSNGNCFKTLKGHTDWVLSLEIINHFTILSSSKDNTIKKWNLKKNYFAVHSQLDFFLSNSNFDVLNKWLST